MLAGNGKGKMEIQGMILAAGDQQRVTESIAVGR